MLSSAWATDNWIEVATRLLGKPPRSILVDYGEETDCLWAYVYLNPGHKRVTNIACQDRIDDPDISFVLVDKDSTNTPVGLELVLVKPATGG
jgi:hypothetical protein